MEIESENGSGSGDDDGSFSLEEFLIDVVEEQRARFDPLEASVAAAGFPPIEEGVWPTVRSTWTTGKYECEHVWDVEHPAQILVAFHQTYEVGVTDVDGQRRLLQTIRDVYEPLAEEGLELWLELPIPPAPSDADQGGQSAATTTADAYAELRAARAPFSESVWFISEYGSETSGDSLGFGEWNEGMIDVIVAVVVVLSLVSPGDDGTYAVDPTSDVSLEVPLPADVVRSVLEVHQGGVPLDAAVEQVTGSSRLRP